MIPMKTFILSDHDDAIIGMRLAGVEGLLIKGKDEAERALEEVLENQEIQILMVSDNVNALLEEKLLDIKINKTQPLIVEISTKNGMQRPDNLTNVIKESIGLRI